ncbi:MAG: hypothetical protein ACXVEF_20550 [Polyangiales bacterium]
MRYLLPFSLVLFLGCPNQPQPVTPSPSPSPSPISSSSSSAAPQPTTSSGLPIVEPDPAAVKSPVFSDDDCSADKDCTGVNTCHPDRCVALANAGTMPTGMMCTMDCRGGTLDCNFNHCGCAPNAEGKKKCAVLPGPRRKGP